MNYKGKLLTAEELKKDYVGLQVFVRGMYMKREYISDDFYCPDTKESLPIPPSTYLKVRCYQAGPKWLNNLFTNHLN